MSQQQTFPSNLPSDTLSDTKSQEQHQHQPQTPQQEQQEQQEVTKEASPATQAKVTKPKKKSKKLCHYKQCTNQHSIIGDCQFCSKKFCTKHRLLEAHDCEHYREVKDEYHQRNAKLLQSQQTVISKV